MNEEKYHINTQDISFLMKKFYAWRFFDMYKTQKIYQHVKTFACVPSTDGLDKENFFEYKLNSHGFRSDEFKKGSADFLYAGCSETFGQGGPIEESWSYMLNKKVGNSGPYINLSAPGLGWTEILSNIFTYMENFGTPKNIFILLPNMERRIVYGYSPAGKLFKIKIFRNKIGRIKENKKEVLGYHLWWLPSMWGAMNKYPRKYKFSGKEYKTLILQRCEQIRTLIKVCNAFNINLVFTINSQSELDNFNFIKKYSDNELQSFFYLNQNKAFANINPDEVGKYDGHHSAGWHKFLAEEMYTHWSLIK